MERRVEGFEVFHADKAAWKPEKTRLEIYKSHEQGPIVEPSFVTFH